MKTISITKKTQLIQYGENWFDNYLEFTELFNSKTNECIGYELKDENGYEINNEPLLDDIIELFGTNS